MAHTEADRQMAVEIVRRNGGVIDNAAVAQVQAAIGKPVTAVSIRTWVKANKENFVDEKNLPSGETLAQVVARKLDEKLEQAAHKFVDHATKDDIILKMNGQQAMTSAAIAIDKMRLLQGLPTEIIGWADELTELATFFRENGIEGSQAIREWRERLAARKAAQQQVSNG